MEVSIVSRFLYGLSKKLMFMLVASAMTAVHRDRLVLACYLSRNTCESKKPRTSSTTSITTTWMISSRESIYLANYRLLL